MATTLKLNGATVAYEIFLHLFNNLRTPSGERRPAGWVESYTGERLNSSIAFTLPEIIRYSTLNDLTKAIQPVVKEFVKDIESKCEKESLIVFVKLPLVDNSDTVSESIIVTDDDLNLAIRLVCGKNEDYIVSADYYVKK